MLKATANTRSVLELWPGPVRILVLKVEEEEPQLSAQLSTHIEGHGLVVHTVVAGGRLEIGSRKFKITAIHAGGLQGSRVDFEEIRTAEASPGRSHTKTA